MKHYSELKDILKGEVGIIIANGPSLNDVPISFLEKYPSFGCNWITKMYPLFCPTYYGAIDYHMQNDSEKRAEIDKLVSDDRCKAGFVNRMVIEEFRPLDCFSKLLTCMAVLGGWTEKYMFPLDPFFAIGMGYNVMCFHLQVAYYMGFQTVLVVGLDYDYKRGYFYKSEDGVEDMPSYWYEGVKEVFELSRSVYEQNSRRIINLTEGSKCDAFERGKLEDW